jgi:hypothetical protein
MEENIAEVISVTWPCYDKITRTALDMGIKLKLCSGSSRIEVT